MYAIDPRHSDVQMFYDVAHVTAAELAASDEPHLLVYSALMRATENTYRAAMLATGESLDWVCAFSRFGVTDKSANLIAGKLVVTQLYLDRGGIDDGRAT